MLEGLMNAILLPRRLRCFHLLDLTSDLPGLHPNVAFLLLVVVLDERLKVLDNVSLLVYSFEPLFLGVMVLLDLDHRVAVSLDEVRVELTRRLDHLLAHLFWVIFGNAAVARCTFLAVEALSRRF